MKQYTSPTITPLGTVHELTLEGKIGAFTDGSGKPFKKQVPVGPGS